MTLGTIVGGARWIGILVPFLAFAAGAGPLPDSPAGSVAGLLRSGSWHAGFTQAPRAVPIHLSPLGGTRRSPASNDFGSMPATIANADHLAAAEERPLQAALPMPRFHHGKLHPGRAPPLA
jgi:hypothetical protein